MSAAAKKIICWVGILFFNNCNNNNKKIKCHLKKGLYKMPNYQKKKKKSSKHIACVPFGRASHLISYEN